MEDWLREAHVTRERIYYDSSGRKAVVVTLRGSDHPDEMQAVARYQNGNVIHYDSGLARTIHGGKLPRDWTVSDWRKVLTPYEQINRNERDFKRLVSEREAIVERYRMLREVFRQAILSFEDYEAGLQVQVLDDPMRDLEHFVSRVVIEGLAAFHPEIRDFSRDLRRRIVINILVGSSYDAMLNLSEAELAVLVKRNQFQMSVLPPEMFDSDDKRQFSQSAIAGLQKKRSEVRGMFGDQLKTVLGSLDDAVSPIVLSHQRAFERYGGRKRDYRGLTDVICS